MSTGEVSSLPALMEDPGEEYNFDATFTGVSLQSLLSMEISPEKPISGDGTESQPTSFLSALGVLPEGFLALGQNRELSISPKEEDEKPRALDSVQFGTIKIEKVDAIEKEEEKGIPAGVVKSEPGALCFNPIINDSSFQHLPELRSMEKQRFIDKFSSDLLLKQARCNSTQFSDSYTLDAIVRSSVKVAPPTSFVPQSSGKRRRSTETFTAAMATQMQRTRFFANKRRKTLSDRMRCLQKVLPSNEKMDTATMLEEACKYIKFLKAQIEVLKTMPYNDNSGFTLPKLSGGVAAASFSDLERMNRQQLLQVLVNSPAAQTTMCSQGCCFASVEQMTLLNAAEERRGYLHQMMNYDHPSTDFFF